MIVFCFFHMKKVGSFLIAFHAVIKAVTKEPENVATSRERLAEVPPTETLLTEVVATFPVKGMYPGKVLLEWLI